MKSFLFCLLSLLTVASASGQISSANGSIQGTILDPQGAGLAGAVVQVKGIDTGISRETRTSNEGYFEIPLLPLGRYDVTVSAVGFSVYQQSGVSVEVGRATPMRIGLALDSVQQSINVSEDATMLRLEPTVAGGMGRQSLENMPITSRNLQNLGLFAPGLTGRRDDEFGTTQFAFGGMARRGFMVDGMDNTQRGGQLRLGIFSTESMQEISVIQNAMAAEYGRTVGGIVNMVTRGGSNEFHGMGLYLARRPGLIARPSLAARDPFQQWAVYSGSLSGPIRRDRLFFFLNAEYQPLDAPRPITITPANAQALSIPDSDLGSAPFAQRFQTYMGRTDYVINSRNFGFARYTHFRTPSRFNTSGGLLVRSAGNNFDDVQGSGVVQMTSMLGPGVVNEFRYGNLRREFFRPPVSGVIGPVVQITGVANLGSNGSANQRYFEVQNQFVNNVSWQTGRHTMKFGVEFAHLLVEQQDRLNQTFVFGGLPGVTPLQQYLNTLNRVMNPATGRPFTYTQLTQQFGDNNARHKTYHQNFFVQDDWRIVPTFTLSFGVRYEYLDLPPLSTSGVLAGSQTVPNDENNIAPRFGFAWQMAPKTVLRGGYGLFYDTLNLRLLSAVIRNDGARVLTYQVPGSSPDSPPFPAGLPAPNPSFGVRPSVTTFAQDLRTFYAHQANVQVEREILRDLSLTFGAQWYGGHRAPLMADSNLSAPTGVLADGRPVFGGARPDPRFNQILVLRPVANNKYYGAFLAANKRFSNGFLFTASYTWSQAFNNNDSTGDSGSSVSDPSNYRLDYGLASADQRHRFVFQGVWTPGMKSGSRSVNAVVNGWTIAPNLTWTSGFPVNVVSGQDLNRDLVNNDRPLFRGRNDLEGPGFRELNLRVSRTFQIYRERLGLEVMMEAENLLNSTNAACGIGGCSGAVVNRFGAADFLRVTSATNARQIQFGARLKF